GGHAASGDRGAGGGHAATGGHAAGGDRGAGGGHAATGGHAADGDRGASGGHAATGSHAASGGYAATAGQVTTGREPEFASGPASDGEQAREHGQAPRREPAEAEPVPDDPMPGGIPAVAHLAEQGGLLVFDWPAGITEVMVVVRADRPPLTHDEPGARAWKVTNMRYQIDGGVTIPAELPRPCHVAVASCRRERDGRLLVAPGVAPTARMHWSHTA